MQLLATVLSDLQVQQNQFCQLHLHPALLVVFHWFRFGPSILFFPFRLPGITFSLLLQLPLFRISDPRLHSAHSFPLLPHHGACRHVHQRGNRSTFLCLVDPRRNVRTNATRRFLSNSFFPSRLPGITFSLLLQLPLFRISDPGSHSAHSSLLAPHHGACLHFHPRGKRSTFLSLVAPRPTARTHATMCFLQPILEQQ